MGMGLGGLGRLGRLGRPAPSKGGGVGWVLRDNAGNLPLYDADYANNRYYYNGQVYSDRATWRAAATAALLLAYSAGTLVLYLTTPAATGVDYWNLNDGTANNRIRIATTVNVGRLNIVVATVSTDAYAGAQPNNTAVRVAAAWAAGSIINTTNGGETLGSSNIPSGLTTLSLIANYQTVFSREVYFASRLTNDEVISLSEPATSLVCWGDSITQATGGQTPYPSAMATNLSRVAPNKGVGGETSSQILTRALASKQRRDKSAIFEMGRNNFSSPTTVKADIASAIGNLNHGRYLVLSILPSGADTSQQKSDIAALNADLLALYGARFVDILTPLQDANDGSPNDLADVAAGIIPRSLRIGGDNLHPNTAGNAIIATTVGTAVTANSL